MRKLTTIIIICLISMTAYAQGLNSSATTIKNKVPDAYHLIRESAVNQWDQDHSMVLYVINKQCEAMIELVNLFELDNAQIFVNAIADWSDFTYNKVVEYINSDMLFMVPVDWSMALYVYKKELKASKLY